MSAGATLSRHRADDRDRARASRAAWLLRSLRPGEADRGPRWSGRVDPGAAALGLDLLAHDRQADAGSLDDVACPQGLEQLPHPRVVLRGDPDAVVGDRELRLVA